MAGRGGQAGRRCFMRRSVARRERSGALITISIGQGAELLSRYGSDAPPTCRAFRTPLTRIRSSSCAKGRGSCTIAGAAMIHLDRVGAFTLACGAALLVIALLVEFLL